MSRRSEKITSVVQKFLGPQLQHLELPFLTTITRVEVSEDLKYAKVWISVLPAGEENEKQILATLKENIYDLQGGLNRKMETKITPRISFAVDHSGEYASHISDLIKKTHEEE